MIFKKKKKTNVDGIVDIDVNELVEKKRFPGLYEKKSVNIDLL